MSVEIKRFRNRKTTVMQSLHVWKFLGGWDTRQIQPRDSVPVLMIVTFLFQITKTCTTKPIKEIKVKLSHFCHHPLRSSIWDVSTVQWLITKTANWYMRRTSETVAELLAYVHSSFLWYHCMFALVTRRYPWAFFMSASKNGAVRTE